MDARPVMRRVPRPRVEVEGPDERMARKVETAFPGTSNALLGTPNVHPYWCEECGRSFLCERSVEKHLWFHLRRQIGLVKECAGAPSYPGRPFQCSECGTRFRLQDSWAGHAGTHLAFPCNCRLWYPSKACLERHALNSHSRRNLHTFLRHEREKKVWED